MASSVILGKACPTPSSSHLVRHLRLPAVALAQPWPRQQDASCTRRSARDATSSNKVAARASPRGSRTPPREKKTLFSAWLLGDRRIDTRSRNNSREQRRGSRSPRLVTASSAGKDDDYYAILGVSRTASRDELKSSFRKLALQWHPDVAATDKVEAEAVFKEISNAYEILEDKELRAIYDREGVAGLQRLKGGFTSAAANSKGYSAAKQAWEEFKPFVKRSGKRAARDNAAAGHEGAEVEVDEQGRRIPMPGDVVEYVLTERTLRREAEEGGDDAHETRRTKGVALLVSRNMDRGDRKRLPEDKLDLCELEPLYQEEPGGAWTVDDLDTITIVRLGELTYVPSSFNRAHDYWTLLADLSPDCRSPTYDEPIMV